jgi:hyperosmotically inducible periplasmic protein
MKRKLALFATPILVIGLASWAPALAQTAESPPADTTGSAAMHNAGESMEHAAGDTADAVKHTYHGAKAVVNETTTTAKVKSALHDDKMLADADIHVSTRADVVTLSGSVQTPAEAVHATDIAMRTEGVSKVDNQLKVMNAANQSSRDIQ